MVERVTALDHHKDALLATRDMSFSSLHRPGPCPTAPMDFLPAGTFLSPFQRRPSLLALVSSLAIESVCLF